MSTWFEDDRRAGWQGSYPPDVPEPDTCGNCRYCVVVDSGAGCEHAAICVRVYEDTADYDELLLVHEDDVACEGFWEA